MAERRSGPGGIRTRVYTPVWHDSYMTAVVYGHPQGEELSWLPYRSKRAAEAAHVSRFKYGRTGCKRSAVSRAKSESRKN